MDQIQEHFSRRVLHDMSSAVLVLDCRENIIYANNPACEMLEVESGKSWEECHFSLYTEDTYNDAFNDAILNALFHKKSTTVETVHYKSPSGKKYVFLLSSSYLPGETDEGGYGCIFMYEAAGFRRPGGDTERLDPESLL